MFKLNNRGFAISGILYSILILFILLLVGILSVLGSRKLILDKTKNDVFNELNEGIGLTMELNKKGGLLADCKKVNNQYSGTCDLSGTQTNNYIWYSGFLWRVVGIKPDGKVKLITEENVATVSIDSNVSAVPFGDGYVQKWLTSIFKPSLRNTNITTSVDALTLADYRKAGGELSYLNTKQAFWLNSNNMEYVNENGNVYEGRNVENNGVRPLITVSSDTPVTGGVGTISDFYIIKENKAVSFVNKKIADVVTSGEYVKFTGNNNKFRVISKGNDGIKLLEDGYMLDGVAYDEILDRFPAYSNDTRILESLVGANNTNKLLDTTWYIGDPFISGNNVINYLETTTNPKTAKIGLIRIGEILSSQSQSISTKKGYWLLSKDNYNSPLAVTTWGYSKAYASISFSLRPAVKIPLNLEVKSGKGLPNSPYEI
ncbi:MAG: hypothetical protein RR847_00510 [Bacilli bacterium]